MRLVHQVFENRHRRDHRASRRLLPMHLLVTVPTAVWQLVPRDEIIGPGELGLHRDRARVRCITPLGTTMPCRGKSSAVGRPSTSSSSLPSSTKNNSSSRSCLCQWNSPWNTPMRATDSLTTHSDWFHHFSRH